MPALSLSLPLSLARARVISPPHPPTLSPSFSQCQQLTSAVRAPTDSRTVSHKVWEGCRVADIRECAGEAPEATPCLVTLAPATSESGGRSPEGVRGHRVLCRHVVVCTGALFQEHPVSSLLQVHLIQCLSSAALTCGARKAMLAPPLAHIRAGAHAHTHAHAHEHAHAHAHTHSHARTRTRAMRCGSSGVRETPEHRNAREGVIVVSMLAPALSVERGCLLALALLIPFALGVLS